MWAKATFSQETLQIIRLTQVYALTAVTLLYIVLLAGPFCYTFQQLPFRGKYLKARRALGVSTFYFGLLHASLAFFGQLGGFEGLGFLNGTYLLAISLSFTALCILALMATTSFDYMIAKLTFKKWKLLHRFVYLAGIFILIHALMLGTHFQDLSGAIPQIFFIALAFLLILEGRRIDAFIEKKFIEIPKFGFITLLITGGILARFILYFLPTSSTAGLSFGIHSQHIQQAKDAQQNASLPSNLANVPGLKGDRTRRFTVSFDHPDIIQPNTDVPLTFKVSDASSGNRTQIFQKVYDKLLHLIIVDDSLTYFTHIHPDQTEQGFSITTQFPKEGTYHLYVDFQPLGATEQQFAFTLTVGTTRATTPQTKPDTNLTKKFDLYQVTLTYPKPLQASLLSIGQQTLTFTVKNEKGQPVTTLKPYLAAFGHLVMINQSTFDYLHVHPKNTTPPKANGNGGPDVEFMPLGLYGPIKPGIYRVFAQLNPDNKLITTDFTVEIK